MKNILVFLAFALALTEGKFLDEPRLKGDSAPANYMPFLGVAIINEQIPKQFEMNEINLCSVILVNSKWVLTSTNCLLDEGSPVYFGTNKWCNQPSYGDSTKFDFDTGYQGSTIKRIVKHPSYGQSSHSRSSLQMAELKESIRLSSKIDVAKFGEENIKMGTDFFDVAGWGQTSRLGPPTCSLRKMQLPVFAQESCEQYEASDLRDDEFCAGDIQGASYTCSMDAGSPLVKEGKIYGLVSYNTDCKRDHPVGVYLNLYTYRQWIKDTSKA